jgi:alanyl-tRNA synthetase
MTNYLNSLTIFRNMLPDKVIKKKYKSKFWKDPDKYYATSVLKEEGFQRQFCKKCKMPFWSIDKRKVCGDAACSEEGFTLKQSKSKKPLSYIETWNKFSKMFQKFGYTEIKRYPTIARWNATMDYTNASIAAFQPYVVSGEVEPPANPLILPQVCIRFIDIDNVGVTMSHNTGFVMIGQHSFVPKDEWDQNKYFKHMLEWNVKGLGLTKEEMIFHEEAWAGGGNLGPCMELFAGGCELWNQVYMLYEQTPNGVKELDVKVLDMGMGLERNAWFIQGTATIYDATFPNVIKKVQKALGHEKLSREHLKRFAPYGSYLNIDEIDNIDLAWKRVEKKLGEKVRSNIAVWSGIYMIAEHTRTILFLLNDGALPSNVGGGYNLRMLIRKCYAYTDKIDLYQICKWHAEDLKPLFPELSKGLKGIKKILDVEKEKYDNTKEKTKRVIAGLKNIDEKKLLELYDSQGISPDMIPNIEIPNDFYTQLAELHEQKEQKSATKKIGEISLPELEETKSLYYDNYKLLKFKAKILAVKKDIVILDQTAFYPTSGGQLHDLGSLNDSEVLDVWKQGNLILHKLKKVNFKKGDKVEGIIDGRRRLQLAQHHTATHIIGSAARTVLGQHINQAGAFKDVGKARLDLTHYQSITDKELLEIEKEANKIVQKNLKITKEFLSRSKAEKKYGMSIYQGGAVPGKKIRIVKIKGLDVQACGGTHLDYTKEVEKIKILKTTKIQDGVVRIVFTAGNAASSEQKQEETTLNELSKLLSCKNEEIPARAKELFQLWKQVVKKKKEIEKKLTSKEKYKGDILLETSKNLKTQPEHIVKTVKRFLTDLGM